MFPDEDIAEFSIGKFTGDRELDKKAALEFLRSEGYDEIPGHEFWIDIFSHGR